MFEQENMQNCGLAAQDLSQTGVGYECRLEPPPHGINEPHLSSALNTTVKYGKCHVQLKVLILNGRNQIKTLSSLQRNGGSSDGALIFKFTYTQFFSSLYHTRSHLLVKSWESAVLCGFFLHDVHSRCQSRTAVSGSDVVSSLTRLRLF